MICNVATTEVAGIKKGPEADSEMCATQSKAVQVFEVHVVSLVVDVEGLVVEHAPDGCVALILSRGARRGPMPTRSARPHTAIPNNGSKHMTTWLEERAVWDVQLVKL